MSICHITHQPYTDAENAGKRNLDKIMYTKYSSAVYIEYTVAKWSTFSLKEREKESEKHGLEWLLSTGLF